MRKILLPLAFLAFGATAAEPQLPELRLTYAVTWKGVALGDAVITLQPAGEAGCYRYESLTDPVGVVRMFYGKPRETSEFCIRKGRVVPQRFAFHNPKRDDDSFTLEFDLAAGTVRDGRGATREIPANAQDRFGLQQAVRLWVLEQLAKKDPLAGTVAFAMVEDDRIKTYRFAITGRETIELPAGRFDAVVVQRVDDPRKTTRFWLAAASHYMPVKVEQIKDGDSQLSMVLKSGISPPAAASGP